MPTVLQGTCKLVMGNGLHYNLQGGGEGGGLVYTVEVLRFIIILIPVFKQYELISILMYF